MSPLCRMQTALHLLQSSSALTFLFYFLSMHPDVLQRLRKEVLDTVGPSARPTYQQIKDMKYLRAVINGGSLPIIISVCTSIGRDRNP